MFHVTSVLSFVASLGLVVAQSGRGESLDARIWEVRLLCPSLSLSEWHTRFISFNVCSTSTRDFGPGAGLPLFRRCYALCLFQSGSQKGGSAKRRAVSLGETKVIVIGCEFKKYFYSCLHGDILWYYEGLLCQLRDNLRPNFGSILRSFSYVGAEPRPTSCQGRK